MDGAEAALDDTVAVDDPRVLQAAKERFTFEVALQATIESSGLAQRDEALLEADEGAHVVSADEFDPETDSAASRRRTSRSAVEVSAMLPHGLSPARLRCLQLAEEMRVEATARG